MRPLIGVTTSEVRVPDHVSPAPQADPPRREMALGMKYTMAVEAAGGLPVVMPPMHDELIGPLLDRLSGVVLSGGPDMDPGTYGGRYHPQLGPTEPDLDHFELQIVQAALGHRMPLLAICRGAQVLNVAFGGTLVQHLPDLPGTLPHGIPGAGRGSMHEVKVAESSRLSVAVGESVLDCVSHHHQAIDDLGQGLVPVAWSGDGVVEAVERDRGWMLGVQWHPEDTAGDDRSQQALFEALARQAAA